jgi:hypothetical protein
MTRTSPLLSAYPLSHFEHGVAHNTRIALRSNRGLPNPNYIADISAIRRRLFVGAKAPGWLKERSIDVSDRLFEYRALDKGALVVRLHRQQYLLIDSCGVSSYDALFELDEGRRADVLVLDYEAAEIACGGPYVADMLSELCPMEVAAVTGTTWIATRLAHCEVAIRRQQNPMHIRINCAPADARFLFGILSTIALERDGAVIGYDDFRALLNSEDPA